MLQPSNAARRRIATRILEGVAKPKVGNKKATIRAVKARQSSNKASVPRISSPLRQAPWHIDEIEDDHDHDPDSDESWSLLSASSSCSDGSNGGIKLSFDTAEDVEAFNGAYMDLVESAINLDSAANLSFVDTTQDNEAFDMAYMDLVESAIMEPEATTTTDLTFVGTPEMDLDALYNEAYSDLVESAILFKAVSGRGNGKHGLADDMDSPVKKSKIWLPEDKQSASNKFTTKNRLRPRDIGAVPTQFKPCSYLQQRGTHSLNHDTTTKDRQRPRDIGAVPTQFKPCSYLQQHGTHSLNHDTVPNVDGGVSLSEEQVSIVKHVNVTEDKKGDPVKTDAVIDNRFTLGLQTPHVTLRVLREMFYSFFFG
ncbi:hypothetical protein CDD81_7987 [Ophiocordyceps australis]|uniref:Uncharacterized protein n=1 Tax=Ophiocordyceps australis TaxID=1399860 RepID=A0A2C5Y281_9HYPO|nr:hypothetical protein CDD81_7987 [Ophiocordyceps australis]